ncbi:MAG: flagellar protein MotY [Vibrionaceae bacterium]
MKFSWIVLFVGFCWLPNAHADRLYQASPATSKWDLAVNSPVECQLSHRIPHFGQALFSSRASKKMNLDFYLKMDQPMGSIENVALVSMPPPWMPGEPASVIDRLTFFKQFDGYVTGQVAWKMLSELESGRIPTFNFVRWQSIGERINVGLSTIAFQKAYQEFNQCLTQLFPYSFEDIAFSVLQYEGESQELTYASKAKLEQIVQFVRHSEDLDLVLLSTYTDARGEKEQNQLLSEQRAKKLKEYLVEHGVIKERIVAEAFGAKRPIAVNDTQAGRNLNRRVVISLGRTVF